MNDSATFTWQWIAVPLISAFIGWITNVIAVKMIFRPRRPVRLLGFEIQGLVPKRQGDLARSIGHTVEKHLISTADVMAMLTRPEIQHEFDRAVHGHITTLIDTKLTQFHPMVGMLLTGKLREKLEVLLEEEIHRLAPALTAGLIERLETDLDFQAIIEERVRAFPLDKLEALIFEIASRELKAIEWLGGVLGFVIGLLQLLLMLL